MTTKISNYSVRSEMNTPQGKSIDSISEDENSANLVPSSGEELCAFYQTYICCSDLPRTTESTSCETTQLHFEWGLLQESVPTPTQGCTEGSQWAQFSHLLEAQV